MKHFLLAASALWLSLHPTAPAAQTPPYTYQGTIQAVQPETASMDLITGVGMALRLVHMRTLPETRITAGEASLAFSDFKLGDIVRAECRLTDTGLVADRVEKLASAGSAPVRQP